MRESIVGTTIWNRAGKYSRSRLGSFHVNAHSVTNRWLYIGFNKEEGHNWKQKEYASQKQSEPENGSWGDFLSSSNEKVIETKDFVNDVAVKNEMKGKVDN